MIKTILVHIDGSPQQDSRLRAAAQLAIAHGAHLVGSAATGISWTEFALLTGSMAAPLPVSDLDGLRDAALLRLQAFTQQAARLGVASTEARLVEDHAAYGLLMQARYADLVVVSQDRVQAPGLLDLAAACGAGLVVAGAHGHSRYREWVPGGVTRDLLAHARLPLLVAH